MSTRRLSATLEQFANGKMPLAECAGVLFGEEEHLVSLVQRAHSKRIDIASEEVSCYMQDAVLVFAEAVHLNPDEEIAIRWFHQAKLSDFEDRTPAEVIADGMAGALIEYIRSLDAGWTG